MDAIDASSFDPEGEQQMEPEDYVVLRGANVAAAGTAIFGMDGTVRGSGGEAITLEYGTQRVESSADIEALEEDPGVVSMAPVMPLILHEPTARSVDAPADDGSTWGVAAVKAQQSPWDGAGITVAILDTGIDTDHPAFAGVDLVQEDFTGDGIGDENGHGTHCAATVFGRNVDGLRIGVAPGVEKALIGKVLGDNGSGSTQSIIAGIEWAVSEGAQVISMSLGLDFPGLVKRLVEGRGFPVDLATSKALEAYAANLDVFRPLAEMVANRAELEGRATVIVAAAGNESQRDRNPNHKIAVAPPAAAPRIISVGALGVGDAGWEIGAFSNTGPKVCGPGVGVRSARTGGGLEGMNGTSMAAPHVAGVAALWAQRQLETIGAIDSFSLMAQVTAKSTHEGLAPNFDPKDVGMGMVQAPLD